MKQRFHSDLQPTLRRRNVDQDGEGSQEAHARNFGPVMFLQHQNHHVPSAPKEKAISPSDGFHDWPEQLRSHWLEKHLEQQREGAAVD